MRPWALAAPIVVLLVSLPLLRPLRHPDPRNVSHEEVALLATVEAIGEHGTLAVEETSFWPAAKKVVYADGHWYSDQPPVMAALLSGSYWVMNRAAGLDFHEDGHWVAYLLTVLGVTLPVAGAAGLIYRMGRLFELHRPWRTALALVVVFGSGLISYATVLNAHAPAAALVLAAAACLIHVTVTERHGRAAVWLVLGGLCAALATTLDPPAGVFLILFLLVIFALRRPLGYRLGGMLLYAVGAAGPILLHVGLVRSATGDLLQGSGFRSARLLAQNPQGPFLPLNPSDWTVAAADDVMGGDDEDPRSLWQSVGHSLRRLSGALVGDHGVFSHFPVLILGLIGVSLVMHRHWPATTKMLASATAGGALAIVLLYAIRRLDWRDAMFASRWFIVFLPLLLFWTGVWLRRHHRPLAWAAAAALLCFSVTVSILGAAAGPLPRGGFVARDGTDRYTAARAVRHLVHPPKAVDDETPVLAGR